MYQEQTPISGQQNYFQKRLLTLAEFCQYTGFSKSYVYKMNSQGKIPGVCRPTGGKIWFDREKIDSWLLGNPKLSNAEKDAAVTNFVITRKLH